MTKVFFLRCFDFDLNLFSEFVLVNSKGRERDSKIVSLDSDSFKKKKNEKRGRLSDYILGKYRLNPLATNIKM
jgi:hypothetical protein